LCSDIVSYIIICVDKCQKNVLVDDVYLSPILFALISAKFQKNIFPLRMSILCEDVETEVECLDTDVKEAAVIVEGITLPCNFYAFLQCFGSYI
jgi:hypothetical protein